MDAIAELFSTNGRSNRAWYLAHILLDDFVVLGLMISMFVIGGIVGTPWIILPLGGAILAAVWAGVAVTIKRFHDMGMSGWNLLWLFVPLVHFYFGFKLLFSKGVEGPNRFGPDPLEGPADYVAGYVAG